MLGGGVAVDRHHSWLLCCNMRVRRVSLFVFEENWERKRRALNAYYMKHL